MKYIAHILEIIGFLFFLSTIVGFISPKSITDTGEAPRGRFSILSSGAIAVSFMMGLAYFLMPANNETLIFGNLMKIKYSLDERNMSPQQQSVKEIAEQFLVVRKNVEELRARKIQEISDDSGGGKSGGISQAAVAAHSFGRELEKLLQEKLDIPLPDHLDESTKDYLQKAMEAHNEWASYTVKKGFIFNQTESDRAELSSNISKYSRLEASLLATALGTVDLALTCEGPASCRITLDE